jgi:hypothetical protein
MGKVNLLREGAVDELVSLLWGCVAGSMDGKGEKGEEGMGEVQGMLMYVYIYVCVCMYVYIYICIYKKCKVCWITLTYMYS